MLTQVLALSLLITSTLILLAVLRIKRTQIAIDQLNVKFVKESNRLVVLYNISQMVSQNKDKEEARREILDQLVSLGWEKLAVWEFENRKQKLKLVDSRGLSEESLKYAATDVPLARVEKEVLISDLAESDLLAQTSGFRSLMTAPLIKEEEVLGILNIYTGRVNDFKKEDAEFLSITAKFLAAIVAD